MTIVRGTSHSISSQVEDLLASYCAKHIDQKSGTVILIDPQISFSNTKLKNKSGKRPLLFRPDICFLRNNRVVKIFDVKTDLGYKRKEIIQQAGQLKNLIKRIKGKSALININGTPTTVSISKKIKKYFVVISGAENSGNIQETKKRIKEKHGIDMLVLSDGDHLNSYKTKPGFTPTKDFKKLDHIIRR